MTPTEVERQLRDHERRLAAIELEQAGQTAIIRDLASCMEDYERAEARITAATPPATVEASAVSEWPRYFEQNDGMRDCIYCLRHDGARLEVFHLHPFKVTGMHASHYRLHEVEAYVSDGIWLSVPRAEAEARIAAARGEATGSCPKCGTTNHGCKCSIAPTAERESEPTPGMVRPCPKCGWSAWQKLVESGGYLCRVCDLASRARDAEQMEREHRATIDALRAENERLKKAKCGADGYIDLLQSDREKLRQQLTTKDAEIERLKEDTIKTCQLVADMHAAATGKPGDGPRRGVVEDIADLRQQLATAREAAEASAKDHEAMEALATEYVVFRVYHDGKLRFGACHHTFHGVPDEFYPTPTAAILAAKDASGTNTGEKK